MKCQHLFSGKWQFAWNVNFDLVGGGGGGGVGWGGEGGLRKKYNQYLVRRVVKFKFTNDFKYNVQIKNKYRLSFDLYFVIFKPI